MKKVFFLAAFLIFLTGCDQEQKKELTVGEWWVKMDVSDDEILPFNFSLSKGDNGTYTMLIRNADERIVVDDFELKGDSIIIRMPVFEGYLAGTFSEDTISGSFIKESLDRIVPFQAKFGKRPRFDVRSNAVTNISGIWETAFDYDTDVPYSGKGIFLQNGNVVTGTFRTTTGDYRYLEGVVTGDTLKLSAFDGAHVFYFTAKVTDSMLKGTFYSGNHSVEKFRAKRNEAFELPDANTLTYLKEGYSKFDFSFPNSDGETIDMKHDMFRDKVVLVQIMGTWCPNCLDETKFYVEYLKKNPDLPVQVVGLAFEYAKTEEKAFEGIKRLKNRVGVDYPILLAQVGTSNKAKANEKLPMLNHVLSYPTTIYMDKKGEVRKIHTGFNGPATGEKHEAFKREFDRTLKMLASEKKS